MNKKVPRLTIPELTTALAHPTRNLVLAILTERLASPKELSGELDRTIRHITYHLEVLEKLDCVELVKTEPVMGGRVVEHFYKATRRAWFDRNTWSEVDENDKPGVTSVIMEAMSTDIAEAMIARTFQDPPDNHISRTPMTVDDEGWDEVGDLLASTLNSLMDIQGRISNRSTPETKMMPIKVEIIQFRSPDRRTE
jgi:DNA-binding transcriptional ArsR family regulator